MKRNPYALLTVTTLLLLTNPGCHFSQPLSPMPASHAESALKLGGNRTDELIKSLRNLAAKQGSRADTMNKLGLAYLQKGRETGELTWYVMGKKQLQDALRLDETNSAVLHDLAFCMTIFHDFPKAIRYANLALEQNNRDHRALGVLTDSYLELGQYENALRSCQRMIDIKPDLGSYSRGARLRWIFGDPAGAKLLMGRAIECGSNFPENVAWCQTMLAEMNWKTGAVSEATHLYESALATFPDYRHAQMGLARIRDASGKPKEAAALMEKACSTDATISYLQELGDIYKRLNEPQKSKQAYERIGALVKKYDESSIGGDEPQIAMFELESGGDVQKALQLSEAEVLQHTSIEVYAALAWSYYKSGRHAEAAKTARLAMRTNVEEPILWYRSAKIFEACGDRSKAKQYARLSLQANPKFHPVYAKEAQVLAYGSP